MTYSCDDFADSIMDALESRGLVKIEYDPANPSAKADAALDAIERLCGRKDALVVEYGRLHDILSDMVEEGRLTKSKIPKDYTALVDQLAKCVGVNPTGMEPIAIDRAHERAKAQRKFIQKFLETEFGKDEEEDDSSWHDRLNDILQELTEQGRAALDGDPLAQRADRRTLDRARELYASDDIQIDDDAIISETDDGLWVQGWVWLKHTEQDQAA